MHDQPETIVAGHICLDIIPELHSTAQFIPGYTLEAGPALFSTGGPVANTGLALHKLGVSTRLMGKVGDDLFGHAICSLLAAHDPSLTTGMIVSSDAATSYTIILSSPDVDRMFIHAPGCNATFGADDIDYAALTHTRLLHFGYPPLMERLYRNTGAELVTLFQRAKATGITTSLDMTMPDPHGPSGQIDWPSILALVLPYVDIFLPSVEELLLMLDRAAFDRLARKTSATSMIDCVTPALMSALSQHLLDMGTKIVGLKAGYRGLYLRTAEALQLKDMGRATPEHIAHWADREVWAPCYATDIVGTTGTGDATIAGFLMGLLRGMTLEETLSAACAVGACAVEATDSISGIQGWQETAVRIAAGWQRLPLFFDTPEWCWDNQHEIWSKQKENEGTTNG
ncbi:MAG: carbohydrate kinase family protein [Chloroflexi bacterium AL-W]|nr:carbohydrate kinase family protein [Chloroflexi bacterium AL-N1]NOK66664.1 carbohydrate kinase family protein [Chloroflexi bacterium AL-N10]NOK72052.1 carbohydrate kinase family protein [Chloroflexi bacterium AL-N5]NOK81309.1 carbohydrate kinase family protein [Chloroflexi bacterium AL-W]NOK89582.1 carbohydrate kinase family protein [Chloroflexi bacterium AL-N15]